MRDVQCQGIIGIESWVVTKKERYFGSLWNNFHQAIFKCSDSVSKLVVSFGLSFLCTLLFVVVLQFLSDGCSSYQPSFYLPFLFFGFLFQYLEFFVLMLTFLNCSLA